MITSQDGKTEIKGTDSDICADLTLIIRSVRKLLSKKLGEYNADLVIDIAVAESKLIG